MTVVTTLGDTAAAAQLSDAAQLTRVPLFQNLRPNQLQRLSAAAESRRIAAGQPICNAGRPSPGLVLIRSGRVLRGDVELGAGQWFDELEALDLRLARETATAVDDVEILVLSPRALHDAVRADPELGVALLRQASRELVLPGEEDVVQLMRYAADLSKTFREGERRQAALRQSVMGAVRALVALAESKDPREAGHASSAARTARALARELGYAEGAVNDAALGGLLHDVGLIAVDSRLLTKPGALTPQEVAHLQAHPEVGARIVENIEFLKPVVPYVLHHHERYDGHGYPRGLVGRQIPHQGRLMAAVEACETVRPRLGGDRRALIRELRAQAGRQLDREMMVAICHVIDAEEAVA